MLVYILLAVYLVCLYFAYKGAAVEDEQDLGRHPIKEEPDNKNQAPMAEQEKLKRSLFFFLLALFFAAVVCLVVLITLQEDSCGDPSCIIHVDNTLSRY